MKSPAVTGDVEPDTNLGFLRPETNSAGTTQQSDPEMWVELYGDALFKYAIVRLRNPTQAEDAVQETFLAALKGRKRFAGRSAEKSWMVGILKNKIHDCFRQAGREMPFTDLEFYARGESENFVKEGLRCGAWLESNAPQDWPNPGQHLDDELFWKAYHHCFRRLPRPIATVFSLRELDGLEGREVCALLNISQSNLWVMLHRARMALRQCLETHWFSRET